MVLINLPEGVAEQNLPLIEDHATFIVHLSKAVVKPGYELSFGILNQQVENCRLNVGHGDHVGKSLFSGSIDRVRIDACVNYNACASKYGVVIAPFVSKERISYFAELEVFQLCVHVRVEVGSQPGVDTHLGLSVGHFVLRANRDLVNSLDHEVSCLYLAQAGAHCDYKDDERSKDSNE